MYNFHWGVTNFQQSNFKDIFPFLLVYTLNHQRDLGFLREKNLINISVNYLLSKNTYYKQLDRKISEAIEDLNNITTQLDLIDIHWTWQRQKQNTFCVAPLSVHRLFSTVDHNLGHNIGHSIFKRIYIKECSLTTKLTLGNYQLFRN